MWNKRNGFLSHNSMTRSCQLEKERIPSEKATPDPFIHPIIINTYCTSAKTSHLSRSVCHGRKTKKCMNMLSYNTQLLQGARKHCTRTRGIKINCFFQTFLSGAFSMFNHCLLTVLNSCCQHIYIKKKSYVLRSACITFTEGLCINLASRCSRCRHNPRDRRQFSLWISPCVAESDGGLVLAMNTECPSGHLSHLCSFLTLWWTQHNTGLWACFCRLCFTASPSSGWCPLQRWRWSWCH